MRLRRRQDPVSRPLKRGGLLAILCLLAGIANPLSVAASPPSITYFGDINNNDVVDIYDLSILLSHVGTSDSASDVNNDGSVSAADSDVVASHFGQSQSANPTTSPVPIGATGTWTTKFADDFSDNTVDLTKWRPNWLAGNNTDISNAVNTEETACFDPAQVTETGGSLLLSATHRSCTSASGRTYPYTSGLIETYDHYRFTYGYMEARMWIPAGTDGKPQNWPAFWADGTGEWPTTGEIDVMEALEGQLCYHFHYTGGGPGDCVDGITPTGWHVFGANWQAGSITYYYDGKQVGHITSGVTGAPMYLIANMSLSDSLGNPPSIAPSIAKIDYIRVWQ